LRELVVRLARENRNWGYQRIVGELRKLCVALSATSVRNILARVGLPPAPRRHSESWCSFPRAHGESILACDFFTVDTVWLQRLYVLVFLSLGSRRIEYLACTSRPNADCPPRHRPALQPAAAASRTRCESARVDRLLADSRPPGLQVNRRDLLGGLIHEYGLAAA
jgi:hypothetical protein